MLRRESVQSEYGVDDVREFGYNDAMARRMTERISFATDEVQVREINAWRRRQDDLPGLTEAIRRLIDLGLKYEAEQAKRPS
jgi:hypothetical protein